MNKIICFSASHLSGKGKSFLITASSREQEILIHALVASCPQASLPLGEAEEQGTVNDSMPS